jgi:cytochrome P450 family 135
MPLQTLIWFARPSWPARLPERYGDPMTLRLAIGPTMVVTADPSLAHRVLALPVDVATAGEDNRLLEPLLGPSSLLMRDGPDHVRLRHLLAPFLRGEQMRAHEEAVAELTRRQIAGWQAGGAFPLLPRMRALTLQVILRVVFGIQESPRLVELGRLVERVLTAGSSWLLPTWLRADVPGSPWRRFTRLKRQVDELLMTEIDALAAAGPRGGMLDDLLAAHRDGELSRVELRDQLVTLLVAGHETTATTLSWCVELLLRDPDALAEVRANPSREAVADVIRETLRLRPVFRLVSRRLKQPWELGGWRLEPGTSVAANVFALHRDARVYDDPEVFRPGRWRGRPPGQAWLPFGGGVRRCLGAAFAQFEMEVILAILLSEVRLRPASDRPEPMALHAVTLIPKHGARVVVGYPGS